MAPTLCIIPHRSILNQKHFHANPDLTEIKPDAAYSHVARFIWVYLSVLLVALPQQMCPAIKGRWFSWDELVELASKCPLHSRTTDLVSPLVSPRGAVSQHASLHRALQEHRRSLGGTILFYCLFIYWQIPELVQLCRDPTPQPYLTPRPSNHHQH